MLLLDADAAAAAAAAAMSPVQMTTCLVVVLC